MGDFLKRSTSTQFSTEESVALVVSAGAADAGKVAKTGPDGRWDASLMPVGIAADTYTSTASGALSAGDLAYVKSDGTIARATAASGSPVQADGFVLSSSTASSTATIYFEGRNTALTGLTVGARYFLSDSIPGGITSTPVSGAGKIHQYVGKAITATTISFEAEDAILLA